MFDGILWGSKKSCWIYFWRSSYNWKCKWTKIPEIFSRIIAREELSEETHQNFKTNLEKKSWRNHYTMLLKMLNFSKESLIKKCLGMWRIFCSNSMKNFSRYSWRNDNKNVSERDSWKNSCKNLLRYSWKVPIKMSERIP